MRSIILLFLFPLILFGQDQAKLDSLNGLLERAEHDSTRAKLLGDIGLIFQIKGNYNQALTNYSKSLKIYEGLGNEKEIASSLGDIGLVYQKKGNFEEALTNYTMSLNIYKEIEYKSGIAKQYTDIGIIWFYKGIYETTLENWNKALNIYKEIGNQLGIAKCLNNIGLIYERQENYKEALTNLTMSLNIKKKLGYKKWVASSLNNIGEIKIKQGKVEKALDYFNKALKVDEELGNKEGFAIALGNIGEAYQYQGEYKKALSYALKSLKIRKEIGDKRGIVNSQTNIANIYYQSGELIKAISYGKKSFTTAKELGLFGEIKDNSELLFKAYKKVGDFEKSLEMHQLFVNLRDSILNIESQQEVLSMDFDNKMKLKEQAHQSAIVQKELQAKYSYIIGGLVILVLITIVLFIYRNYRLKSKSNQLIKEKNEQLEAINAILDEKNHDIMSNITYAKKIQDTILPSVETMKSLLPDSFNLYLPKDVVSGDFYWVYKDDTGTYFSAVDCTGHGVSGAFMSIIGLSLLSELVGNQNIKEVDEILHKMREYIITSLNQTGKVGEARDGMDIALCKMSNGKIEYAGAFNPLIIVRNRELLETKGDQQPIGFYTGEKAPFKKHIVDIEKGDMVYVFSDGYQDQFGGARGRKFMAGKFKKLLVKVSALSCEEQHKALVEEFTKWKGSNEQVDDICVMGVRV